MINKASDQDESERQLLLQVAQGDQTAFAQLFRQYMPTVYRHLLLYLKNAQAAQEQAQDVFMVIWKNREKLAGMENFPGYLYVITRNKGLKAVQKILAEMEEPPEDMIQTLLQQPESAAELKDLQRILFQGIASMPERRRQVFTLSRVDQLSYQEIADELHISTNAVKFHIMEALVYLRTFMKEKADIIVFVLILLRINFF